jgi:hypothetical protein
MNLIPTWDLFILILFVIIVAYSFLIGRNQTSRIIIATYIALLAADGLGNYLFKILIGPNPSIQLFSIQASANSIVIVKLIIMCIMIVALALKGGFEAETPDAGGTFLNLISGLFLGFLSAGLIVGGILVYLSGGSFLPGMGFEATNVAVNIYNTSQLARLILDNSSILFSLPAVGFILMGTMKN